MRTICFQGFFNLQIVRNLKSTLFFLFHQFLDTVPDDLFDIVDEDLFLLSVDASRFDRLMDNDIDAGASGDSRFLKHVPRTVDGHRNEGNARLGRQLDGALHKGSHLGASASRSLRTDDHGEAVINEFDSCVDCAQGFARLIVFDEDASDAGHPLSNERSLC